MTFAADDAAAHVERTWDDDIVPALHDYIRIPNVSVAYDADWAAAGHMARATELLRDWCQRHVDDGLKGATVEVLEIEGRTPILLVVVPSAGDGRDDDTVLRSRVPLLQDGEPRALLLLERRSDAVLLADRALSGLMLASFVVLALVAAALLLFASRLGARIFRTGRFCRLFSGSGWVNCLLRADAGGDCVAQTTTAVSAGGGDVFVGVAHDLRIRIALTTSDTGAEYSRLTDTVEESVIEQAMGCSGSGFDSGIDSG